MAERRTKNTNGHAPKAKARSGAIASAGIHTGEQFAGLMSALMSDVIEGRISPTAANAACNAGGKLLKIVEMQYRYAQQGLPNPPSLLLAPEPSR